MFGIDQSDLKKAAKDIIKESEKEFAKVHGYDKEKIIKEMNDMYSNREIERKVFDKAVKDNKHQRLNTSGKSRVPQEITENEEYLDMWYKLQNGTTDWPVFVKGNPNARDVVEAALSDAKKGRATYIASVKGGGDEMARNAYILHKDNDYGKMLYTTTEKSNGANYTYSILGNSKATRIEELKYKQQLIDRVENELSAQGFSKEEISKQVKELRKTLEEIQDIYDQNGLKQGTTRKKMSGLLGKDVYKPKHYEEFSKDFIQNESSKTVLDKLNKLHEKVNRILENKGMPIGQVKSGIIRIKPEDRVGLADWGGTYYGSGIHNLETFANPEAAFRLSQSPDKKKQKLADALKTGKFTRSDDLVAAMTEHQVDLGIIDNIKDPAILGTNVVVKLPSRFRVSRKLGGYLDYVGNFKS